jgi:hypothetical protein
LATSIGVPVTNSTGPLIKRLRPLHPHEAPAGTLSSIYGTSSFPFHTDTAFWTVPAKFVLLRAIGDLRRATCVCTFHELFKLGDLEDVARESVWTVPQKNGSVYCTMTVRDGSEAGYRYDKDCMSPKNRAATYLSEQFTRIFSCFKGHIVKWTPGKVLILSNWLALHARDASPIDEGERTIERIYVR